MITGNLPDLPLALLIDPAVPKITDIDRLPGKHDHRHGRSHGIDPVACAVAAHCLIHNLAGLQKKNSPAVCAASPYFVHSISRIPGTPDKLPSRPWLSPPIPSKTISTGKLSPKPLTAAHFLHSQILGRKNLPTAPEIIFII